VDLSAPGVVRLEGLDTGAGMPNEGAAIPVSFTNDQIVGNGAAGLELGGMTATLDGDTISGNAGAGVTGGTGSLSADVIDGNADGLVNSGGTMTISGSTIDGNTGNGVQASGASASDILSGDTVSQNGTGLQAENGGTIVVLGANNSIYGNTINGSPTSTVTTGAIGPVGPAGIEGIPGTSGLRGMPGTNGIQGPGGAPQARRGPTVPRAQAARHRPGGDQRFPGPSRRERRDRAGDLHEREEEGQTQDNHAEEVHLEADLFTGELQRERGECDHLARGSRRCDRFATGPQAHAAHIQSAAGGTLHAEAKDRDRQERAHKLRGDHHRLKWTQQLSRNNRSERPAVDGPTLPSWTTSSPAPLDHSSRVRSPDKARA
jgi:hypothetical protein